MRPIQFVILLVALGAAAAAGMLALRLAAPRPSVQQASAPAAPVMKTEDVLVAAKDIGLGSAIDGGAVTWKTWPASGLSDGYITRTQRPDAVTELAGYLVRIPMSTGEPVKESKLVRSDRGFLSAVLPAGMRAVAVRVNAASTAGGFVLPEDRVDVILIRQAGAGEATSETILQNIRVLAIDQTVEQAGGEKSASVVAQDTATLELTPEQSELVVQAQQIGTIALALRSIRDQDADPVEHRKPSGVNMVKFGVTSRVTTRAAE
ncbi:Flp pilus assembly protein CpaB [Oharaeibacter diazotrophicus]|uniref:Pilus assembly protein CpaB n=1 Tax=Oharaeibacter diazotrophicus TaxID=1920512 RepID=A0A4R6REG2_9HYPH|nr:Flp pilus assembly protein CpaB [Oharaeibacter diazotrophicus]TDP84137.1 pilus assembly protein CpaB [Oharaeibacter diazotrophicus]BBE73176.1 SAF domain protein [Pleomorphomonas sp. SM30]GLS74965.1 Flp pilus assembly protein CpaB [Oharaeibacter diazotrophicus]